MAAPLLPWQLTAYIFILCLISQITAQWEKRGESAVKSPRWYKDGEMSSTFLALDQGQGDLGWLYFWTFSLFCLCGTNFLISAKASRHMQAFIVSVPGKEHGCCWVEIWNCFGYNVVSGQKVIYFKQQVRSQQKLLMESKMLSFTWCTFHQIIEPEISDFSGRITASVITQLMSH